MTDANDWSAANQRDLVRALERMRALLIAHSGGDAGDGASAEYEPDPSCALARVARLFELSAFERDILVLCAGMEMDARFPALVAAAHGDPGHRVPTFALALAVIPGAHWSALTPDAPLRAWRLVELAGPGVTTTALRIDERVLNFLAGLDALDERLRGIVEPMSAPADEQHIGDEVVSGVAAYLAGDDPGTIVQITGADADTRLDVAARACATLGASALRLRSGDIPVVAVDRFALARLLAREALLMRAALVVDVSADADGSLVDAFAESLSAPMLVCAAEPLAALAGRAPVFELAVTTRDQRLALWRAALGDRAPAFDGALGAVCAQFDLSAGAIRAVVARVSSLIEHATSPADAATALWDACRLAARPRMDGLAQRVEAMAGWDDLVLPEAQLRTLHDVAAHVRQRDRVYMDWGFADKTARGLGISALFAGASGTGKTMAAEVLARELRLDLYRIDLASVVSKYIGETEKNLKRLFDAAERSSAILLFDEADALFGKRSEVKDSHDRYANIEVSYLLQRMESYRGLAILTSNMKNALDPAFLRRIRFVIQFPFPPADHRAAIWRGIFPARTPTAALDYTRLSQLNVAGGHIRNIALAGAFLAAERGEHVSMSHLAEAARGEYAKLERPLSDAEMRGWT